MHIQKKTRNGTTRYLARYTEPNGKERTRSFRLEREARAFLKRTRGDIARGEYVAPEGPKTKFRDWAEHVDRVRVNRRETTRARDASLMANHVLPTFGERELGSVTVEDVEAWIASLAEKGLAPNTTDKCYQLVRRVMASAVRSRLIMASPCVEDIARPSDRDRKVDLLLTPQHVDALVQELPDRYRALVLTAAFTGMRWGELTGLRVERINFLRRKIDVAEALTEVNAPTLGSRPKTEKSRALVSFPSFLAEVLARHIEQYPDPDSERGLVFTSDHGTPLRRSNFRRRVWEPTKTRAKLPTRATFHHLRHATASWLIDSGATPLEVAEKLRHEKITTTLSVYGHLFDSVADRLDETLDTIYRDRTNGTTRRSLRSV